MISADPVFARFTFKPERAGEFLEEGRLVTQIECDSIDEVMAYVNEFNDALLDCNALINGREINLSDYQGEVEDDAV